MRKSILLTIGLVWLSAIQIQAQNKISTVRGEAQVKLEDNISKADAKAKAKELAIINALENEYGAYIAQENKVITDSENTYFRSVGTTKVKGEWIETLDTSYIENVVKEKSNGDIVNEIWITCKIKGKAKPVKNAEINFESVVLNCPLANCHTEEFYNDEQLYLQFKAPTKGFVSVYITEGDVVYRLLPYIDMTGDYLNGVAVEADQSYTFFSQDEAYDYFKDYPSHKIDELIMYTDLSVEYAQLNVIFSPDKFIKPILKKEQQLSNGSLPKSLNLNDFEEWVRKNKIHNPAFSVNQINITTIKK